MEQVIQQANSVDSLPPTSQAEVPRLMKETVSVRKKVTVKCGHTKRSFSGNSRGRNSH